MDSIEDQSGIQEILEAEIEQLELDLQARKLEIENLKKTVKPESVQEELAFDFFTVLEGNGLLVTGVALAEGIWKNVVYSCDEIKKAADQLMGKPLKIEHGQDKEFGDRKVGEVIEAKWDELLKALKFKAKLTDQKAIDYINAGRFKAVSMSTWMDKIPIGQEGIKMGLDFKFAELSLVENPACDRCFIFHCEKLSKMEKDLKGEKKEIIIGEQKMEKEENSTPNLEISEEEGPIILAWVEDNEELELLELDSEEKLEELRKNGKLAGYYYGYPHKYGYYGYYPYYGYPYSSGYYGYYPYKYKKYKKPEMKSEDHPVVMALVEDNETLEEIFLSSETELDELRKTYGKKVKGYKYAYSPYGYYPYKYKKYKKGKYAYPYPKPEKKSEDEDLEEVPFEEMEDSIVCKACGAKFTNFKDFIKHWVKDHMEKYGKYQPAEKQAGYYPKYYRHEEYYPYYPHYPYYPKYEKKSDDLKGQLKIVFNKKTKKYTVFEVPEEGLWKIVKVFDTKPEAQKFISGGGKEEKAAESPTPIVCPVCGLKFENEVDFNKHWGEAHVEKYGVYKPQSGEYPPLPEQKSELKEVNNLKEGKENMTEAKKEEPKVEVKVEPPKVEPQKIEPPKEVPKEEPKVEAPKEEPKVVEAQKVEPKLEPIEIPIVIVPTVKEVPKEEPKVEQPKIEEAPKVETPKVEPPKPKMTEEDILKVVKESPEAQRLILEKWIESKRSPK